MVCKDGGLLQMGPTKFGWEKMDMFAQQATALILLNMSESQVLKTSVFVVIVVLSIQ